MGAPVTPAGLLLLLHLTAGTSAEPHYVVVSPAQLYHPHTGTVSVHLSDLNETVRVSVRLERGEGLSNVTLLEREVQEPRLRENLSFQVPAPSRGQQEAAELHLSVRGDTLQFSERTTVLLRVLEPGTFVQTDKAAYKPGQTVKFRIVTLDKDFVPSARPLPLVTLQDPHGNRIAQWRDVTPQQGIVDLSLPLAAELALGPYAIEVQGTRRWFSVEEYEPPKFEVTLQLPPVVTVLDKALHLRVCGRYTDGKPVLGRVQATLCRLREKTRRSVCVHLTGQTESDGCLSWEVGTPPFHLTRSGYRMNLEAMASLMEEGTGVVINATRSCLINIVSEIATVTFEEADAAYRAGIPYTGKMLLRAADGSALKNETLRLFVSSGDISENQTFLTDESGRASFTLDTSGWTGLVALRGHFKQAGPRGKRDRVSPRYPDAHHRVEPFYSRSRSFLKFRRLGGELPCGQTQRLHVDYVLVREALGNGSKSLDFIFLVVAKGAITRILHKGLELHEGAGLKGSFSVELPVGAELAPAAKVLGYTVLPDGEMAADSALLRVAKCLPNKVKLAFSQDRALPGSELQLQVQAAPGSLCAVRAVDRSVLLVNPEAELSVDTVYNLLPDFRQGDSYQGHKSCYCQKNIGVPPPHPHSVREKIWQSQRWRRGTRFGADPLTDPNGLFQDAALKLLTNTRICEHQFRETPIGDVHNLAFRWDVCSYGGEQPPQIVAQPELVPCAQPELAPRAYFPETWLWDLVAVGEGGSTDVPLSVPDTLTQWKAGMFCTAEGSFGLSPTATLTVVKPFFVELALPYSVVRGEAFTLKATVSNSLQQCIKVRVTLAESAQFRVQAGEDGAYSSCLCADEGKTFQWEVTASSLASPVRVQSLKQQWLRFQDPRTQETVLEHPSIYLPAVTCRLPWPVALHWGEKGVRKMIPNGLQRLLQSAPAQRGFLSNCYNTHRPGPPRHRCSACTFHGRLCVITLLWQRHPPPRDLTLH
ncbi:alpha-2-macroglobulin-like protein 1 isoform X2 [Pelodiscus sinensis]|uniref:alpha-2-macroglobulin-like protein 1 isoform X2 n=1 Tax=Pelodiscus sinensis TaxID=13735 RepID=UPI003F6CF0DD